MDHYSQPPQPNRPVEPAASPSVGTTAAPSQAPASTFAAASQPASFYQPAATAPQPSESAVFHQPAVTTPGQPPKAAEVYPANESPVISWSASEFIAHQKNSSWYFMLAGGAFIVSLLVYLLTRDVVSAGVVVIGAVLFGVMAGRQPRQLQYAVYDQGITIGSKAYPYKDFRSFSVVDEGHFSSIVFMPLKRFAPPLSIYYHPDDERRIVEVIAVRLPMQAHKRDFVESLMRQIRF